MIADVVRLVDLLREGSELGRAARGMIADNIRFKRIHSPGTVEAHQKLSRAFEIWERRVKELVKGSVTG